MTTAILLFLLKKTYTFTEQGTIVGNMARALLIANAENATIEELKILIIDNATRRRRKDTNWHRRNQSTYHPISPT
jgi:hypothetical protein